jgi:hypothetical protein
MSYMELALFDIDKAAREGSHALADQARMASE